MGETMITGDFGVKPAISLPQKTVNNTINKAAGDTAPPARCYCGCTHFWRRPGGEWLCCRCHPMPGARARLDNGTNKGSGSSSGVFSGK